MSDARQMLRSGIVICTIAVVAWGSYWIATSLGYSVVNDWGKYAWSIFVFQGGLFITLILRTYDVQNIEALSQQQRQSVREIVKRRVDALWALFLLNILGVVSALAAYVARNEGAFAVGSATLVIFFLAISMLGLLMVPSLYDQIEQFKSLVIQTEREAKARSEILKEMTRAADAGYKPDPALDQYNHLIEPNSHA